MSRVSIAVSMSDSTYNNWKQIKFKMQSSPVLTFPLTSFLNVHIPSGTQKDVVRQILVIIDTRRKDPKEKRTFFFDLTANSWLDIKVEGEQPLFETEPTATAFPNVKGSPIIFFGGNAHENATWRLETNQVSGVAVFRWKRGAPGPYPSRTGHAAAAIGKKLIVYGGVVKQYPGHLSSLILYDMASYDIDKDEWSYLLQMNEGPFQRWSPSYASVFDRYLLIAGGWFFDVQVPPDGFAYDVKTRMWYQLPAFPFKYEIEIVVSTGVFRRGRYEQDAYDWVLLTQWSPNILVSRRNDTVPKTPLNSSVFIYRFSPNNVTHGRWLTIGVSKTVYPGMPWNTYGALPQVSLEDDSVAIIYAQTLHSTTFENGMWFYLSRKQNYNWGILPKSQEPGRLAGFTFTVTKDRKKLYVYGGFYYTTDASRVGNVDGTAWSLAVDFSIDPGLYKWERYLPARSVCSRLTFSDALRRLRNSVLGESTLYFSSTLRGHSSVAVQIGKETITNCLLIFGGVFYYLSIDQLALVCPESFLFRVFHRPEEWNRKWMSWPSDRAFHSAVIDGSTMFIFGGVRFRTYMGIDKKAFLAEDLWSLTLNQFDFSSNPVWTKYIARECPPNRFGHTAVVAFDVRTRQKHMLIFGGTDFDSTFRDLWQFTLPSGPWSQILYTADSRSRPNLGLRHHTAVMSGRQMLVYGGCRKHYRKILDKYINDPVDRCPKNRVSDSLLAFDMYERHWRTLQPSKDMPARYFHGMVLFENKLLVYGGIGSDGAVVDTILTLQPSCNPGEEGDFFTDGCRPCDVGYYSDNSGPACDKCSLFFSTKSHGSSSSTNCSECSEICDFGGTCVATRPNIEYECHCRFPFSGNTCKSFWPLLVFTASVLVSMAVIFLIYKIVQYVKRARRDAENLQERENEIGDLLEGWRIEGDEVNFVEKIGEGGFGEVWLAEYREMQVAVKILNENERLFVDNSNELFQQEIDFMRHLRHPNIVLFLGAGSFQTDGNLFLVTEFVSRGSLHGVLTDGSTSLTVDQNIGFCLDSANGMRFLHELNPPRIHRDLKAANLLVSQNWVVKVSDFGTARRLLKSSKDEIQTEISAGDQFPLSDSDEETQPLLLARYKNMSWRHGTSLWKAPELLMQQAYGASVDIYRYKVYNLMLITHDVISYIVLEL